MAMYPKTPIITYVPWLKLNLDLFIVIYLKIFKFLSPLMQYILVSWCMKRNT